MINPEDEIEPEKQTSTSTEVEHKSTISFHKPSIIESSAETSSSLKPEQEYIEYESSKPYRITIRANIIHDAS